MPLYEYACARCGRRTEVIQSFSDPPLTKCPHCGGALTKLLSPPAVQFKGSGFYVTDYGRSGGAPGNSPRGEEKEGDRKGKADDSSKGQEGGGGGPSEAGAGTKGDSAESSKEKADSGSARAVTEPSSRSRKKSRGK